MYRAVRSSAYLVARCVSIIWYHVAVTARSCEQETIRSVAEYERRTSLPGGDPAGEWMV